jgi:hypothetical protein
MATKHSIRNSRLLITFLHCAHKPQLSDFFNTYACYQQLFVESPTSGLLVIWVCETGGFQPA